MTIAMQPIFTQTVGAGGAATVVFNNIPQTFTDLKLEISGRTQEATLNSSASFYFGLDSLHSNTRLYGYYNGGSATGSDRGSGASSITLGNVNGASATASAFSSASIYVPNYTGSNFKSAIIDNVMESNTQNIVFQAIISGLWRSSSAVTLFGISCNNGWAAGSTFTLYGITKG